MRSLRVGVLGASSLTGERTLKGLCHGGHAITAFSRNPPVHSESSHVWRNINDWQDLQLDVVLSFVPIWVCTHYLEQIANTGARRLIILSSTSRFTKAASTDPHEQELAQRLAQAEAQIAQWAQANALEWVIMRPTMIYGLGRDKNIAEISHLVQRFRFFPLFGKASGLRQPLHVDDLAQVCMTAATLPQISNGSYNLSGAEALPYRCMVRRVFKARGITERIVTIPLWVLHAGIRIMRILPRYRHLSAAMVGRMNQDMTFDHSEARAEFGFSPRRFDLSPEDVRREVFAQKG